MTSAIGSSRFFVIFQLEGIAFRITWSNVHAGVHAFANFFEKVFVVAWQGYDGFAIMQASYPKIEL